jgi:hypothetical protein
MTESPAPAGPNRKEPLSFTRGGRKKELEGVRENDCSGRVKRIEVLEQRRPGEAPRKQFIYRVDTQFYRRETKCRPDSARTARSEVT